MFVSTQVHESDVILGLGLRASREASLLRVRAHRLIHMGLVSRSTLPRARKRLLRPCRVALRAISITDGRRALTTKAIEARKKTPSPRRPDDSYYGVV